MRPRFLRGILTEPPVVRLAAGAPNIPTRYLLLEFLFIVNVLSPNIMQRITTDTEMYQKSPR